MCFSALEYIMHYCFLDYMICTIDTEKVIYKMCYFHLVLLYLYTPPFLSIYLFIYLGLGFTITPNDRAFMHLVHFY